MRYLTCQGISEKIYFFQRVPLRTKRERLWCALHGFCIAAGGCRPYTKEALNKSAAADSGSFVPTFRFENLETHKVFLRFSSLNLEQNPSLTALADLFRASLKTDSLPFHNTKAGVQFPGSSEDCTPALLIGLGVNNDISSALPQGIDERVNLMSLPKVK